MAQSVCPQTLMDMKFGKLKANLPVFLEDMPSFPTNESVTLLPRSASSRQADSVNPVYAVAIAVGVGSLFVFLVALLVYLFIRRRSGPVWISKIAHMKDKYTTMADEQTVCPNENFIIGFSNPVVDSTTDASDGGGGVTVIGYRPLETDMDRSYCENFHNLVHFPRDRVVYGEEQGTGWFGKVYEGEAYRIKLGVKKTKIVIKELMENADLQTKKCFLEETKMLGSVKHENLITVFGHSTEKDPFLALLEYTPLGNLKHFLLSHRNKAIEYHEGGTLSRMCVDMASGLSCLHSHNFFHRDFSARNCIVASDMSVKIGDYGISRSIFKADYYSPPSLSELPIPLRWLPPEGVVVSPKKGVATRSPSEKGNVWSFGVTLWELVEFGRLPYEELTDEEVLQSVVLDRLYQLPEPKQQGKNTDVLYNVMKQCWLEPNTRPSMYDVTTALQELAASSPQTVSLNSHRSITTEAQVTSVININPSVYDSLKSLNKKATVLEDSHVQPVAVNEPLSNSSSSLGHAALSKWDENPNRSKSPCSPPVAIVRPLQLEHEDNSNSHSIDSPFDICASPVSTSTNTKFETEKCVDIEEITQKNLSESVCVPFNGEACTPPPVTYIGDPSDSMELFRARTDSENSSNLIRGTLMRSHSTDSTTSQDSVLSSGSEYVMLPGETTRRRSSFRQANYQSGRKSVHYPANILALRTIYRYIPEPVEYECDSEPEGSGEETDSSLDQVSTQRELESKDNQLQDKGEMLEGSEDEGDEAKTAREPSSPVEKKIRKATRRQKLEKGDCEWTVTLADTVEKE